MSSISEPVRAIKIFYCYAHKDKRLRGELEKHLEVLRLSRQITAWYDREIPPGTQWKQEIDKHLNSSDIILLLISPDFMNSNYCYSVEMRRALERHRDGEAHVIPIILRPVVWEETPIGELQVLPSEGKPITQWSDRDKAFLDVVGGIRRVINILREQVAQTITTATPVRENIGTQLNIQKRPMGTLICLYRGHPAFVPGSKPDTYTVNSVNALAWSPVGPYIASTSRASRSIHVWDAFTGRKLQTCYKNYRSALKSGMYVLAWSPDGMHLASASEMSVYVWDPFTGKRILVYEGHYRMMLSFNEVSDLAWSPDGSCIASVAGDRAQIWHVRSGDTLATYHGHSNMLTAVAWLPDGVHVVSGGLCDFTLN